MPVNNLYELERVSVRLVHDRDRPLVSSCPLNSPDLVAKFLHEEIFGDLDREIFAVLNLKTDNTFEGMKVLTDETGEREQNMIPSSINICSMGTLNESQVHPREVLKSSILSNANAVILIHNHPSGRLVPGKADIQVTDRLIKAYDLMGIPVLDHLILGPKEQYYSFCVHSILPFPDNEYTRYHSDLSFTGHFVAENDPPVEKQNRHLQCADSALNRLNDARAASEEKKKLQGITESSKKKTIQEESL